jgi:GTP-binding protein HflX
LVAAFHATLEEALQADLLVQVIDASDADQEKQREATWEVLKELGALASPMIHAFNKIDLVTDRAALERPISALPNAIAISTTTGEGLDDLRTLMNALLVEAFAPVTLEVPYAALHLLNLRSEEGRVLSYEYGADSVTADAELGPAALSRLRKYIVAT